MESSNRWWDKRFRANSKLFFLLRCYTESGCSWERYMDIEQKSCCGKMHGHRTKIMLWFRTRGRDASISEVGVIKKYY